MAQKAVLSKLVLSASLLVSTSVFADTESEVKSVDETQAQEGQKGEGEPAPARNELQGSYLGIGNGAVIYFDFKIDDDIESDTQSEVREDEKDSLLKLYAGYHFNKIVGVEFSYQDYGKIEYSYSTRPPNPIDDDKVFLTHEYSSFSAAANLGYSFNNGWRPFGIAGLSLLDLDSKSTRLGNDDRTKLGFHYGLGGEYIPPDFKRVSLRVAYEADAFFDDYTEDADGNFEKVYFYLISSIYASVAYHF